MTLEAGFRIPGRIDNVCAAPSACFKVKTARAVTGLTALAFHALIGSGNADASVIRVPKIGDDLFVAKGTGLLAYIIRTFNRCLWCNDHSFTGGTSKDGYECSNRENEC
jgi:hypothetical protein